MNTPSDENVDNVEVGNQKTDASLPPIFVFSTEVAEILKPFEQEIQLTNKKRTDPMREFAKKLDVPSEGYENLPKTFENITYDKLLAKGKTDKTIIGICGPGASGKNTVKEMLGGVKMVINTTTREQRNNETQGVHYNFLTDEEFKKMNEDGGFLTTTHREGRGDYGVKKDDIVGAMNKYSTFLIEENPATIYNISEKLTSMDPNYRSILVYILPPDPIIFTLASRLANRSLTSGEPAQSLLDTVLGERQHEEFLSVLNLMDKMDVLFVVNDIPARAKDLIESLYKKNEQK